MKILREKSFSSLSKVGMATQGKEKKTIGITFKPKVYSCEKYIFCDVVSENNQIRCLFSSERSNNLNSFHH